MSFKKHSLLIAALMLATFAQASEPGSGSYAKNCAHAKAGYNFFINKDGSVAVETSKALYKDAITSYSFFGNDTPSDFLVAIMFNEKHSPLPAYKGKTGWIEIWKKDGGYYALENGRASKELKFCGKLD